MVETFDNLIHVCAATVKRSGLGLGKKDPDLEVSESHDSCRFKLS